MNKLLWVGPSLVLWLGMSCSARSDRAAALRDVAEAALLDGRYAQAAASYQKAAEMADVDLASRELFLRRAVQCLCYADCGAARRAIDLYLAECQAGTTTRQEFEILVVASNARCDSVRSVCLIRLETVAATMGRPVSFLREKLERSTRPFEVVDADLRACLDRLDRNRLDVRGMSFEDCELD